MLESEDRQVKWMAAIRCDFHQFYYIFENLNFLL
jgi:hypothetical protein